MLLKKYFQFFSVDLYNSIHNTPIYVFFDINKNKDLTLLIKDESKRTDLYLPIKKSIESWNKIYNEFVIEFPPKKYIEDLKERKEIALLKFEAVAYNERFKNTLASIKEEQLLKNQTEIEEIDYNKNIVLMSKHLGYKINPRKISIFEYYNNLKALSNGSN